MKIKNLIALMIAAMALSIGLVSTRPAFASEENGNTPPAESPYHPNNHYVWGS